MTKPLWEVLQQAHLEEAGMIRYTTGSQPVLGEPDRFTRAAEIRAVAEWIEKRQIEDYAVTLPDVREVVEWLNLEADRAENHDN